MLVATQTSPSIRGDPALKLRRQDGSHLRARGAEAWAAQVLRGLHLSRCCEGWRKCPAQLLRQLVYRLWKARDSGSPTPECERITCTPSGPMRILESESCYRTDTWFPAAIH